MYRTSILFCSTDVSRQYASSVQTAQCWYAARVQYKLRSNVVPGTKGQYITRSIDSTLSLRIPSWPTSISFSPSFARMLSCLMHCMIRAGSKGVPSASGPDSSLSSGSRKEKNKEKRTRPCQDRASGRSYSGSIIETPMSVSSGLFDAAIKDKNTPCSCKLYGDCDCSYLISG